MAYDSSVDRQPWEQEYVPAAINLQALVADFKRAIKVFGLAVDRFLLEPIFWSAESSQFVGATPLGQLKAAMANTLLQEAAKAAEKELRKRRNRRLRENLEMLREFHRILEGR